MNKWIIYLRKSRADEEFEKQGELETLSKHRNFLFKFAKEKDLNITKIYEEIVSGESIIHRPEMIKLLSDIETKQYSGVLVMDIDRLGRGGMQDQGLILETFKLANAKIITPRKTYDLNDEFDEEYSEFEAFMARKELKMINKRMQSGRLRSVESGNYISTFAPYGYIKKDKTLEICPEQSAVIRMIFDMYVNQNCGCGLIVNKLTELGIKSQLGKQWGNSTVLNVLKNPIYTGKIVWKKKKFWKPKDTNKRRESKLMPKSEWLIFEGKHPAIIDEKTFHKAQNILSKHTHTPTPRGHYSNSLAGLIVCKECGNKMVRRPYTGKETYLMCYVKGCNRSTKFSLVELRLMQLLNDWLENYSIPIERKDIDDNNIKLYEKQIISLTKELDELSKQKASLHDFLERGIYTVDTFLERSKNITDRIETLKKSVSEAEQTVKYMKHISKKSIISLVVISCICLTSIGVIRADSLSTTKQKAINNILSSGGDMKFVNDLEEKELLTYADITPISRDVKYYKIAKNNIRGISATTSKNNIFEVTKEEYLKQVLLKKGMSFTGGNDQQQNDWLSMELRCDHIGNGKYKYSLRWEWLYGSICREEDIFGIGHDESSTQTSTTYSVYKADYWLKSYDSSYKFQKTCVETTPLQNSRTSGGAAVSYNLWNNRRSINNGDESKYENHRGYMSYNAVVNDTSKTYMSVWAHYAHEETTVSLKPSFSLAGANLAISVDYVYSHFSPNPYMSLKLR